jgi:hypothetical protein
MLLILLDCAPIINIMPVILVIDRGGSIKELSAKTYDDENLFKKAGFKTPTDFALHHVFGVGSYNVHLYGKTKGKAGQENKYDFPPPVDHVLFFGSCLLVNKRGKEADAEVADLSLKEWETLYEKLFGGFEDLAATADDDEEEESIPEEDQRLLADPNTKFTKQGYVKDDFIVDDDEEEEDDDDDEDDDSSASLADSSLDDTSEDLPRPKSAPVARRGAGRGGRGGRGPGGRGGDDQGRGGAAGGRGRGRGRGRGGRGGRGAPAAESQSEMDDVVVTRVTRARGCATAGPVRTRRSRKEPGASMIVDDEPVTMEACQEELSEEAYFA